MMLYGDFNGPEFSWKDTICVDKGLGCGSPLERLLTSKGELDRSVIISGNVVSNNYKVVETVVLAGLKTSSRAQTSAFRRSGFGTQIKTAWMGGQLNT